jgi:hypothetical protein
VTRVSLALVGAAIDLLASCGFRTMEARWIPVLFGGRAPFLIVFIGLF